MKTKTLTVLITLLLFTGMATAELSAIESNPDEDPAMTLMQDLGCRACHVISAEGGSLAPNLDQVGSRLTGEQIRQWISSPAGTKEKFMPEYRSLSETDVQMISRFLSNLK